DRLRPERASRDVDQRQLRREAEGTARGHGVALEQLGSDRVAGDDRARPAAAEVRGALLVRERDDVAEPGVDPRCQAGGSGLLVAEARYPEDASGSDGWDADEAAGGEDHVGPGSAQDGERLERAEGYTYGINGRGQRE